MTILNHEAPQVVEKALPERGAGNHFFRYGAVLPLAAVFTVGLTLTMAALVATEFTPQDKTETASFEINPVVEDIPDPIRTLTVDPLRDVEVPPPPPTVATESTEKVEIPIIEIPGEALEFKIADLDILQNFDVVPIDKDPTPLVRIPPVIPNRFQQGDVSGYCKVRFDVGPEGTPFNIAITICTNRQLETSTVKSVQKWKYAPKIHNGRPVSRSGLETTVRFNLADERGNILPVPSGY